MRTLTTNLLALTVVTAVAVSAGAQAGSRSAEEEVAGKLSFLSGYPAINDDGTVNVVVECPAGSGDKWEVEDDGVIRRQYHGESPKVFRYLAMPANYGMIPRTLLAREVGGDGEPLDALVLGRALPRGTVVRVRVIGTLALLDEQEQDDKLVTVVIDDPFFTGIGDISDLDSKMPGITSILETWFVSYKGQGVIESYGFVGSTAAMRFIAAAASAYDEAAGGKAP